MSSRVLLLRFSIGMLCLTAGVQAVSRQDREALFLAGCEVLSLSHAPPARKASAWRWLVRRTGITRHEAIALVEKFRGRPEDWRRMLENVRLCLEESEPSDTCGQRPTE